MDIKEKVSEVVEKAMKDKAFQEQFQKDPIKAVESVLGVDLPDGMVDKIVDGVKAKLSGDKLAGAVDSLKKLL